jgi:hypothetical protein
VVIKLLIIWFMFLDNFRSNQYGIHPHIRYGLQRHYKIPPSREIKSLHNVSNCEAGDGLWGGVARGVDGFGSAAGRPSAADKTGM